jgi:hypothetical protein
MPTAAAKNGRMPGMTKPVADPRAVAEYRIAATSLSTGDLVNTAPGSEDDWQQVLSVHTTQSPGTDAAITTLIAEIGDRYVVVRLTDVAPVDSPVYFENGAAMAFGTDGDDDAPVTDIVSDAESVRTFLYTRFELVNVRA